jgi:O-antigen/teichoic acid export membrane protein
MVLLNTAVIFLIPKQQGMENSNPDLLVKLYFAYFVITGVVLAVAFCVTNKSWQRISLPSLPSLKLLIRYAALALAANIIFFLVYRVDYWFVKRFCTPEELGNYIQVSKLAQMLLIVPTIISSVVFPHTAGGMHLTEMKDNILRIGRVTTVLYILLFLIIMLTGQWAFPFVFGYTYQLMYVPFLLLLPGVWALSNLFVLSAYFGGINRVKVNVQGAVVGLILILAGDFIFIPRYGIKAAALISTVGYTANFIYSFLYMRKDYSISITEYWKINKDDIKWLMATIKR